MMKYNAEAVLNLINCLFMETYITNSFCDKVIARTRNE